MFSALAALAGPANAASVVGTFKASVVITPVSACVISVTNMDFGTLTAVTGTETATSNVQVRCPQGVFLTASFLSTGLATTRNSAMTGPGGAKINFTMSLAGWFGFGLGNTPLTTVITGKLAATPTPANGTYTSVETLYVIY